MKTKSFKHGKFTYKAYMKPAGRGWEVGFVGAGKPIFVGNFLHKKEATAWYTNMTKHIASFTKKYWITPKASRAFYNKFMTHHLYKTYYTFLDKHFAKYERDFKREFTKSEKKYKRLKKTWRPTDKVALKRAV